MEKQRTPLQMAIYEIKYSELSSISDEFYKQKVLKILTELLPTEREVIEKAVIFGNRQENYDGTEEMGKFYFDQTFVQS